MISQYLNDFCKVFKGFLFSILPDHKVYSESSSLSDADVAGSVLQECSELSIGFLIATLLISHKIDHY